MAVRTAVVRRHIELLLHEGYSGVNTWKGRERGPEISTQTLGSEDVWRPYKETVITVTS